MYDFHLIVNPRSLRTTAKQKSYSGLLETFHRHGWRYHVATSGSAEELTVLTKAALVSGARKILPIGGDGTLSLCAKGFFQGPTNLFTEAALVPMPFGTGQDFFHGWMPEVDGQNWDWLHPAMGCESISVGHYVDAAGTCGYFVNSLSLGISAAVLSHRQKMSFLQNSPLSYLIAAIRELWQYRALPLMIQADDGTYEKRDNLLFIICKGRLVGGGMKFLKDIDPTSPTASALWAPRLSPGYVLRALPKLYQGRIDRVPKVKRIVFEQLRLDRDGQELDIEVDGEIIPLVGPVELRILPRALSVARPFLGR